MTVTEFEHLLLLHGSHLERWPVSEREAAAALVETDPAAKALWLEARQLNSLLGAAAAAEPVGSGLTGAILARTRQRPAPGRLLTGWRLAGAGAGLGAIALAGFMLGFVDAGSTDAAADALLLAMGGSGDAMWWAL